MTDARVSTEPPPLHAASPRRQRRHHRQQPRRRRQLVHHREQLRLRRSDDDDPRQDHHTRALPASWSTTTAATSRGPATRSRPARCAKASLGNGLLYAYTKPKLTDRSATRVDAWYFTAIDIRTGKTKWSRLTGTGIQWNNHYAAIYLGPDGAAYIATLAGLIRIKDAMKTYVVSGAASGIGAATAALLREQGHRVITVDQRDADVVADLSTAEGRADAVAGVQALTDVVHGVVPCAGIVGVAGVDSRPRRVGQLLRRDRPRTRPPAPARSSRAARASCCSPPTRSPACRAGAALVAELCLADDEEAARADAADASTPLTVYPATKAALAWWARREGITEQWIGQGIRLNSVAPGIDRQPDDRPAARRSRDRTARRGLPVRDQPRRTRPTRSRR